MNNEEIAERIYERRLYKEMRREYKHTPVVDKGDYWEQGICPQCKEHCDFEEDDEGNAFSNCCSA